MSQSTESMTVTLPPEMSARIRAKIESGEYESEIDVIRNGIDALDEVSVLEPWQVEEVLASCAEYDADPSSGFTSEQMKARLEAECERLLKTSRSAMRSFIPGEPMRESQEFSVTSPANLLRGSL